MWELNCRRRSALYVEEKAAKGLRTKPGVLGPVMVRTTVDATFPTRDSSVVSHLGIPARASPELKVVSSVAAVSIEYEVRIPCSKSCVTGVSS